MEARPSGRVREAGGIGPCKRITGHPARGRQQCRGRSPGSRIAAAAWPSQRSRASGRDRHQLAVYSCGGKPRPGQSGAPDYLFAPALAQRDAREPRRRDYAGAAVFGQRNIKTSLYLRGMKCRQNSGAGEARRAVQHGGSACAKLEGALARHQHGVDDVDHAVRLHHVGDGDLGACRPWRRSDPDRAVLDIDGQLLALDGLQHRLAAAAFIAAIRSLAQ